MDITTMTVEEKAEKLKTLLLTNMDALVDDLDSFTVNMVTTGTTCLIDVSCTSSEELGKLIGKQNKTYSALIRLLASSGAKLKVKAVISLNKEPQVKG